MIRLYTNLLNGDGEAVCQLFAGEPVVDDQRLGRLEGRDAILQWASNAAEWLTGLDAQLWVASSFGTPGRTVVEYIAWITTDDGRVDLPIVAVGDNTDGGLTEIRTYHSTWPWTGGHIERPPILLPDDDELPAVVADYLNYINAGDGESVQSLFVDYGYMQEASGARWRHAGPEGLARLYGNLRPNPDLRVDPLRLTFDGRFAAVEYNFTMGTSTVAGVDVFELAANGQLVAIRVHDDAGF